MLARFGRPVWQIEPAHVDALLHTLLLAGRTAGTRRRCLDMLRAFHTCVRLRYASEVRVLYGTAVGDPLDRFDRLRHVRDEPAHRLPPPTAERLTAFFARARARLATVSDYPAAARDYALWCTLYHSAPRLSEALRLELCDVHPGLGPSGMLHVRFGKAASTSGPRPRRAPMLDGLDRIPAWYQSDIRPLFPDTAALFCDAHGAALKPEAVRDCLARLLDTEGRIEGDRFTPHDLRRAGATHHYEQGMDLITVQQLLGHEHIASTMAYVRPCLTFVEDAWRRAAPRRATSRALAGRLPGFPVTTPPLRAVEKPAPPPVVEWKLRMTAAQRGIWTGTELRCLLAERAGLGLSAVSVSALFTEQPSQVKLSALAALCAALDCTPGDLLVLPGSTAPSMSAPRPDPVPDREPPQQQPASHHRSLPPL